MSDNSEHWDTDFDPEHPDLQHEQPPLETTDEPDDFEPDDSEETAPGELPSDIPGEYTDG